MVCHTYGMCSSMMTKQYRNQGERLQGEIPIAPSAETPMLHPAPRRYRDEVEAGGKRTGIYGGLAFDVIRSNVCESLGSSFGGDIFNACAQQSWLYSVRSLPHAE